MTDPNYTAVALLVDRSGSMHVIRSAAEDAINEFIENQATAAEQDGSKRTIRLATFDRHLEVVHTSRPAGECPPFKLEPRGVTALLDSLGHTIIDFGAELAAMPEDERPGVVILAVMTDGIENSSWEYRYEQIADMVRLQREVYGWQVLYLGANQDAIETASRIGVDRDHSITYAATDHGTHSVVGSVSRYVASAACGQSVTFTDEDREDAAPLMDLTPEQAATELTKLSQEMGLDDEPVIPPAHDGIYPRCVWCRGENYMPAVLAYSRREIPCSAVGGCGRYLPGDYPKYTPGPARNA